jgi:fructokinase
MSSTITPPLQGKPLIYGEVLFDIFPGDKKVLGGAPFNVAWHLQGFGLSPLFISRIGADTEGQAVVDAMYQWAMDSSGIQRDEAYPTGGVEISMHGTDHRFDIRAEQAYDHIDFEPLDDAVRGQNLSLVYQGSLIARNPASRDTLQRLIRETHRPVFIDVNLRDPWWDAATLEGLLKAARWAKLNDEELATLLPGTALTDHGLERASNEALSRFQLDAIVVTRGAEGAFITTADETVSGRPPPVEHLVDTVGAGDAFCAVTLFGLHQGWSTSETLGRALAFASAVCEQRGATSTDRELYERTLASWGLV